MCVWVELLESFFFLHVWFQIWLKEVRESFQKQGPACFLVGILKCSLNETVARDFFLDQQVVQLN